uniref:Uncharacterized protein n=1 Tax=Leersia perrieri TaxID=77586 RepID=A0A0D9XGZ3_9ORYZ
MSPPQLLRPSLFFAAGQSPPTSPYWRNPNLVSASYGAAGSKQDGARIAVAATLGHKNTQFEKRGLQIERGRQRAQRHGGPVAGGGGWSGGGGGWFRWFTSGGFWDAAKQTLLTIFGIIAAFFLIANFNVLVAAIVNSLLAVLRQIRRALSFIAHCVVQSIQSSAPGRTPASLDSGNHNQAASVVKDRVGKSAKERVVRKWGMD